MTHQLKMLALCAGLIAAPAAQAGWWESTKDFFGGLWSGTKEVAGKARDAAGKAAPDEVTWTKFYGGAGVQIVKAEFPGQLQRRIGGDPATDPSTFYINEPGIVTTPIARVGWQPLSFLSVEALYGGGIDKDRFSENPDSRISLESVAGLYLRPQYTAGSFRFYGLYGASDFEFQITDDGQPRDPLSDSDTAWGAGIELLVAPKGTLAFEYLQHYDKGEDEVFGIGVHFTYQFGGGGGDAEDDYY